MKIAILDDHPILVTSLRQLMDTFNDMHVVFATTDEFEMEAFLKSSKVDILLLDITLSATVSGLDFIKPFKKIQNDLKIVMLTMHRVPRLCEKALQLGADGFVTKSRTTEELRTAVKTVSNDGRYICQDIAQELAFASTLKDYSSTEISKQLGIHRKTVNAHKYACYRKIGVRNDREFLRFALKHHLIS